MFATAPAPPCAVHVVAKPSRHRIIRKGDTLIAKIKAGKGCEILSVETDQGVTYSSWSTVAYRSNTDLSGWVRHVRARVHGGGYASVTAIIKVRPVKGSKTHRATSWVRTWTT